MQSKFPLSLKNFRVWFPHSKRLVTCEDHGTLIDLMGRVYDQSLIEDPIVMQHVLTNRDGQDIYEHDLVEFGSTIGVVCYYDDRFVVQSSMYFMTCVSKDHKVVGNIYQSEYTNINPSHDVQSENSPIW